RDGLPHGHEAESGDLRVPRGVDQVVEPARLESVLQVDVGRVGDHLAGFQTREAPVVPRHLDPGSGPPLASRQGRFSVVEVRGGIDPTVAPDQWLAERLAGGVDARSTAPHVPLVELADADLDLGVGLPGYRLTLLAGNGEIDGEPVATGEDVAAPAGPEQRVALAHQKAVPRVCQSTRVVPAAVVE